MGIMGIQSNKKNNLPERERKAINMAKKEIENNLERDFPKLYSEYVEEASWRKINKNTKDQSCYSEEESLRLLISRRVRDYLTTDLKFVKQMDGMDLDAYDTDKIKQLLITLFYFRMNNEQPLYRDQDNIDSSIKSINANIKKGKFLYRYDEVYESLIRISNNCRKDQGNLITARAEEGDALLEYHKEILPQQTNLLIDVLENDQKSMTEKKMVFENWYQIVCLGISVMKTLENKNYNLLYAYAYFTVILERMRRVVWYIFRYVLKVNEEIKSLELFFDRIENDIHQYKVPMQYDIVQHYGLCMELYGGRNERRVWIEILQCLQDLENEKYQAYDEKYSVVNLDPDSTELNEIREKFCEKDKIRPDRFKDRLDECIKIYHWFSEKALRSFPGNRLVTLKAIYRECFIYNEKIPSKFGKIKSLLNTMDSGKLDYVYNMSEQEFFFAEKIQRGIYRELDQMELYIRKNKFMIAFYEGEIGLMNNMSGFYLSNWTYALLNNIKELLEVGG